MLFDHSSVFLHRHIIATILIWETSSEGINFNFGSNFDWEKAKSLLFVQVKGVDDLEER